MSAENETTQPAPSGDSQKSPPSPSPGSGLAKLVGGAAIVGLNITFLGPSAVYFCLWIAGVAMFIGGIAKVKGSITSGASTTGKGTTLLVVGVVVVGVAVWLASRALDTNSNRSAQDTRANHDRRNPDPITRNTPSEAVTAFTRQTGDYWYQNMEVIKLMTSGESGYAVLADGKVPKERIGYAILGVMRLDGESSWGIPMVVQYAVAGNTLTKRNVSRHYPIHALVPVEEISNKWQAEWVGDLKARKLVVR